MSEKRAERKKICDYFGFLYLKDVYRLDDTNGVKTLKTQPNSHFNTKCPGVLYLQRTDGLPQIVSLVCRTAPGHFLEFKSCLMKNYKLGKRGKSGPNC